MIPKSMAPIESRFAGICRQSRQMKANSSANGMVTATISAVRTLNSNSPRMISTSTMPRSRLRSTVSVVSSIRYVAVVIWHHLHVGRQHVLVESSVILSTLSSTLCACSPTRIRMTPSTASSCCMISELAQPHGVADCTCATSRT